MNTIKDRYDAILGSIGKQLGKWFTKPPPPSVPTPTSTSFQRALDPNTPTREELIRAIKTDDAPVATMAGQMADLTQKYPIYKKNPFLPVATAHLESRGFRDFTDKPKLVNKPKQAFGWAATSPSYNPPNVEQVLEDMMSAVGSSREGDEMESRRRTAAMYEPFRQTNDLRQYALTYAGPRTEQNPYAGEIYYENLKSVMNRYLDALNTIMKERGGSYPMRY